MESLVSELALRVRGEAADAVTLRASAEAFARDALARCDEVLARRAPGRVLIVRELDLSLRLRPSSFGDPADLEAVALAIADDLERRAVAGDDAVGFVDEIAWRAAHLDAWAHDTSGGNWRFAALEEDGEPGGLLRHASDTTRLVSVLQRLFDEARLEVVLEALSDDVIQTLWVTLGRAGIDRMSSGASRPLSAVDAQPHGHTSPRAASRDAIAEYIRGTATSLPVAGFNREASPPPAPSSVAGVDDESRAIETRFGGACYLLALVLEWGVAESLWAACLSEGLVLAHAFACALGAEAHDDPAPAQLGGVNPSVVPLAVSAEQQHEVALDAFSRLVEALTRGGAARLPVPRLDLVNLPGGRLLIVTEHQTRNVLLAIAAGDATTLTVALDAFLARWPASAPTPLASAALAIADPRGRLRAETAAGAHALASNPLWDGWPAAALAEQLAGSLVSLFTARLGSPGLSREALVGRWLAVPARVIASAGALDVHMAMSAIDLEIRRAGLDRNPGFVPWLDRHVRVVFDEE